MQSLNHHRVLEYFKKQINKNTFVAEAILTHVVIVIILYGLSCVSVLKFNFSSRLQTQASTQISKQMQVIQATSITKYNLDKKIQAYENHQAELQQAIENIKKAKQQAFIKDKKMAKLKIQNNQQTKLEAQKNIKKIEQKILSEKLAKQKSEAEESARKEIEKDQIKLAISKYIVQYQERVGANWIKDHCRGIYDFPRAIIKNGEFMKLTGTTDNYRCDQSLIAAIQNTTPPVISNKLAKQKISNENISFIFRQM